ncbi:DUF3332 family protein [Alcanivorax sp. DP30]|uniref:DUF3332 family protein n=1 Tax=Alcanivorax sp. DP30 TaxID=2606217 RepID=UPI00136F9567|nr:DUF3332 family protein [Alcanivorax sp. DP30]MZR63885.1 DUF3332 family protein [Alcanivorax sp. DP30]
MKKAFTSAACAMMLTGCLGQNALFDTVQDWNATATNNKFVNQGISFVFWWVPVYGLSLLGDIIIFNSIEFWTGTNPISNEGAKVAGTTETVTDGMGNQAELTYNADGSISVLATSNGIEENYTLIKENGKVVKIQDQEREVLGTMLL